LIKPLCRADVDHGLANSGRNVSLTYLGQQFVAAQLSGGRHYGMVEALAARIEEAEDG